MKLIHCVLCGDVIQLRTEVMRTCYCGKIKGQYIDHRNAEVSKEAISIAIGNGSLMVAIAEMMENQKESNNKANRESYYEVGKGVGMEKPKKCLFCKRPSVNWISRGTGPDPDVARARARKTNVCQIHDPASKFHPSINPYVERAEKGYSEPRS